MIDTAGTRMFYGQLADVDENVIGDVVKLCDEIDNLRTRLAKAQAARDAAIRGSREIRGTLLETEFRLAAIEKLCEDGTTRDNWTAIRVLAAARGEGTDG